MRVLPGGASRSEVLKDKNLISFPLKPGVPGPRFGNHEEKPLPTPAGDTFKCDGVLNDNKHASVKLKTDELVEAIATNNSGYFDHLFDSATTKKHKNVAQFSNTHNNRQMKVTCVKGEESKRLIWFDFEGTGDSPILDKLAKRFTFAKVINDQAENSHISYEIPHIDKDNAQLTAYCMKLNPETNDVSLQKLRLYAGENFFLTTHAEPRFSIDKATNLLMDTGKYKKPGEMLTFIMNDTIHRYGNAIESLTKEFKAIAVKMAKKETDDTVMEDFLKTGEKIDKLYENVIRQKQVVIDLMELNVFHESPFLNNRDLQGMVQDLEHHMEVLDHYQDRKNGLIELHHTNFSNDMSDAMKRIASYGLILAPTTAAGALWGMNVAVPGATEPNMFMFILGGIATATAGIFARLKYRKWI